jgi:putative ABC transport system permease protein
LSVVRAVVIVIILLGIGNTMMMSAMERAGEMGTTLALGYTRRFVLAQFLCEGLLIGIAGGILGLLLSWMAAAGIGALHIEMPPPPGLSRGYLANVLITPALLFQSLIVAIVTTAAATLYPAWRVSRVPIVDALRKNR